MTEEGVLKSEERFQQMAETIAVIHPDDQERVRLASSYWVVQEQFEVEYRVVPYLEQVKSIPAIALTADAGEFDRQQALQAGFQQHLTKPIEPAEIVIMVTRLCGRKEGDA